MSNPVILPVNSRFDFNKKLLWSAVAALIFIGVSLPQTYQFTGRTNINVAGAEHKCPTAEGKLIHAIIFFVINYFIMKVAAHYGHLYNTSDGQMAKYAFYATLLFLVLSSTDAYTLTNKLLRGASNVGPMEAGCPELNGIIINGIVFFVVILLTMYFPVC